MSAVAVADTFSFSSFVALPTADVEVDVEVEEEDNDDFVGKGELVTILYNIGEQRTAVDGSSNPTKLIAGMLSWDRIKI